MLEATKERGPLRPSTRRGVRIRVLLVAGQTLLRAALRAVISRERDMEVVGDAGDDPAVSALAMASRPDVAVLDLSVPGPRSLVLGEALRLANPATRLLVLGRDPDPSAVRTALAAGVTGYLVRDADSAELLEGIRAVYRARLFVHLGVSGDTSSACAGSASEPSRRSGLARLSTGEPTKLGLPMRSELMRFARDRGLLRARAAGRLRTAVRVVADNNDGTNS